MFGHRSHSHKDIDVKTNSYWQYDIGMKDNASPITLPKKAQVVLVGAGLTNLMCALQLQRAGWDAVIIESRFAGAGCSARSGGFLLASHSYTVDHLRQIIGINRTHRLLNEIDEAFNFVLNFINAENLDVDLQHTGRFSAISQTTDLEKSKKDIDALFQITGKELTFVEKPDVRRYVNSDLYQGGVFYPNEYAVHPAKMTQAFIDLCMQAGVCIVSNCTVKNIAPTKTGKIITTDKGAIIADIVVSGTNGYTAHHAMYDRGFAMRLMPVYSMVVVTPEMSPERLHSLLPNRMIVTESTRRHCYYRHTPCGRRLMLGGRASLVFLPCERVKQKLEQMIEDIFQQQGKSSPKLEAEYTWLGRLGFTHRKTPFIHKVSDTHYRVGGYSGTGMINAPYLGYMVSQIILQNRHLDDTVFTQMLHTPYPHLGGGWFLSPLNTYYRCKDYVTETF